MWQGLFLLYKAFVFVYYIEKIDRKKKGVVKNVLLYLFFKKSEKKYLPKTKTSDKIAKSSNDRKQHQKQQKATYRHKSHGSCGG